MTTAQRSSSSPGGSGQPRKRLLKTALFAAAMAGVLALALLLSRLDQPPDQPADAAHRGAVQTIQGLPRGVPKERRVSNMNFVCQECHLLEDLPPSHPLDHEKFECLRCHPGTRAQAGEAD